MSAMITPFLNSLTDFSTQLSVRQPRHVALQPAAESSGNLDLSRFLAPTANW